MERSARDRAAWTFLGLRTKQDSVRFRRKVARQGYPESMTQCERRNLAASSAETSSGLSVVSPSVWAARMSRLSDVTRMKPSPSDTCTTRIATARMAASAEFRLCRLISPNGWLFFAHFNDPAGEFIILWSDTQYPHHLPRLLGRGGWVPHE